MRPKSNHLIRHLFAICLLWISWHPLLRAQSSSDEIAAGGVASSSGAGAGGNLNFQADLFTGRFSYSVPIKVAPARQGSEPKLALAYSSATVNGWCGKGWSLDTAYIQRDGRHGVPVKWSGSSPVPQYDDTKGFVASFGGSSSPLVRISAGNPNPIVYRQHIDSGFLVYNFYSDNHWEVVDKDGTTYYFGEGPTNQMWNTNWASRVRSSTYRWALDKVIDVNGNATYLKYTTDNGALYLTNIAYNANLNSPTLPATHEINFILGNGRADTNISFLSGYRVEMQKILSEIDVKADGVKVRKYVLGYFQTSSTIHSLLNTVTEYGSDYTTALPPTTFTYQALPTPGTQFGPPTTWPGLYSQGQKADGGWNAITALGTGYGEYVTMADIDGDGLPDRVMRKFSGPYNDYFAVQRNTGSGFAPVTSDYQWGPVIDPLGQADAQINSPRQEPHTGGQVDADLVDINGDGYPDRIRSVAASGIWSVQTNTGVQGKNSGFSDRTDWAVTADAGLQWMGWRTIRLQSTAVSYGSVTFLDMNGDGLPDRVMSKFGAPFDRFRVQLNTGNSFANSLVDWAPLDSQGNTDKGWNLVSAGDKTWNLVFMDMNGDGLPDRVMTEINPKTFTNTFVVQFNNGAGFEPGEDWCNVNNYGSTSWVWNSPIGGVPGATEANLIDVNGDGLPDRVMEVQTSPYTAWNVQFNTGSGFRDPIAWGPVYNPSPSAANPTGTDPGLGAISATDANPYYTIVDFFDINGDGLPDRVMRSHATSGVYDNWTVQLNQGSFPDLLSTIDNGIGGSIRVSYVASTTLDNRDKSWGTDPWASGAKSLLPFNTWVVSQIKTSDGMGNTSVSSYLFQNGYYNAKEKEFRGFAKCTVTDPLKAKTVTYFHQSGGRDYSTSGEYQDQNSFAKMGMPYRIDVFGSDGKLYKTTLNKVQEVVLDANGWYFPFVSQTIAMTYEGLNTCRAVATQFTFDPSTLNLVTTANLGEVNNVTIDGQTFTDIGDDSIFTKITYANINPVLNRANDIKITADVAGTIRLRETKNSFDSKGNMVLSQTWLDTAGAFILTVSNSYDIYGNIKTTTDAAGVTTTIAYDSAYQQFPVTTVVGSSGTFIGSARFDILSGAIITATNAAGLVCSNTYDVFFRPIGSYISTTAFGLPTLWQTRTFYSQGGISGGLSQNCVHSQVNDAVDSVNGYEVYTYADGFGRTIETRAEAETGQFRVANAAYDLRGRPFFKTLPYFSSGTAYTPLVSNTGYLGSLTEYDPVGRAFQTTSAVKGFFTSGKFTSSTTTGGDSGSPVGSSKIAFSDGGNPWATVVTDALGKVVKSYRDAYGRTIQVLNVASSGNVSTTYIYDLLGNLTNVTDNASSKCVMSYDNLGRKTSMLDPDMGLWTYAYDNASRLTLQTDARTNRIGFTYADELGRLTVKQITNTANALVGSISYIYDHSDDLNYPVFPGQLYKVTDLQGYQRFGYDVRGRMTNSARFLNVNKMEYVTHATYDDADRLQKLTFPGDVAAIKYSYDIAGHLSQVKSLSGTGTEEIFYTPGSYDALNQLSGYTCGNGVATTYGIFPNSTRLKTVTTVKGGTTYQNLAYTYDTVSDLTSISDSAHETSEGPATVSNIKYDDLYRVTSLASPDPTGKSVTKTFGYNAIGNLLNNPDNGTSAYQYGTRPHAVTSANNVDYTYDPCGNMISRGNQKLIYDEQNQLAQVASPNGSVVFGYDYTGERLFRADSAGYTIWIGGTFEINNGRALCHVIAGGQLIATFEPQCGTWSCVEPHGRWKTVSASALSALAWPFQKGRDSVTVFGMVWAAVISLGLLAGRGLSLNKHEMRRYAPSFSMLRQTLTVVLISNILLCNVGFVSAAVVIGRPTGYDHPIFYYYHVDHLGSSNVITDRSGTLVQHYEYTTFGASKFQSNAASLPISSRYTGQTSDDDTGLYYYGGRYYDAALGRFIQADPFVQYASDSQSFNRYSYCRNNPLNATDPSGYDTVISTGGGGSGSNGGGAQSIPIVYDGNDPMGIGGLGTVFRMLNSNHSASDTTHNTPPALFFGYAVLMADQLRVTSVSSDGTVFRSDAPTPLYDPKQVAWEKYEIIHTATDKIVFFKSSTGLPDDYFKESTNCITWQVEQQERINFLKADGIFLLSVVGPEFLGKKISVSLGRYKGGYQTALDEFAVARNAPHSKQWAELGLYEPGLQGWGEAFDQAMSKVVDSGGKIHFRLDGVNVAEALAGDSSRFAGRYTAWELQQVTINRTLFSRTSFYLNDAELSIERLGNLGIK